MLSDLVLPSPFVVFFLPCDRLTEIVHKEEDSYFIPEPYIVEGEMELSLKVPKEVKNIRIDPAMGSCMVKIREFTFNGEAISLHNKRVVTINGSKAGNTMIFTTEDPNINLHLEHLHKKPENILWLKMKVQLMDSGICEEIEKELKRKIRL